MSTPSRISHMMLLASAVSQAFAAPTGNTFTDAQKATWVAKHNQFRRDETVVKALQDNQVYEGTPDAQRFRQNDDVPHRSLVNVLDLHLDTKHHVNQFLSFPEIENANEAGAYGLHKNDLQMIKYAAEDPNRDPTLDDNADFQIVEAKVADAVSRAQERSTESADTYAQEWIQALALLVEHPKITQAEDEKLKLYKWTISNNQPWTLKAILASGSFDPTQQWKIYNADFPAFTATNALESACQKGHLEIVQVLLEWNRPNGALIEPFYNQPRDSDQPLDFRLDSVGEFSQEDWSEVWNLHGEYNQEEEDNLEDSALEPNSVDLLYVDPTINNNNAIDLAVQNNHHEIVHLLLRWQSPQGDTFVDPTINDNALFLDICNIDLMPQQDYTKVVDVLLQWQKTVTDRNSNQVVLYVDATAQENRALDHACLHGHTGIVRLLLDWQDPVDASHVVDPSGSDFNDPLDGAAEFGHLEIVKMLLKDDRVDATVNSNRALRAACYEKHIAIVHSLLEWTGPNGKKVYPISPIDEAYQSVEDNINELERMGQSGEQWKNVLHQFVSNPHVDKKQLLKWAETNDKEHTIVAIRAHAQQNLKRQGDDQATSEMVGNKRMRGIKKA